jgi:hypothetical protein
LPWAESTLSLATNELGLPAPAGPKGAVHRTVFWIQLSEPAYRVPAELQVARETGRLVVATSKPLRLRLFYSAISPELAGENGVEVICRAADGPTTSVVDGVIYGSGFVDWHAAAQEYEIQPCAAGH